MLSLAWLLMAWMLLAGPPAHGQEAEATPAASEAPSQAENIARLQRTMDVDRRQLAKLLSEMDDPRSDYKQAERRFQQLDDELERLSAEVERLRGEGRAAAADKVQQELDAVQSDRDLARERFDLEIKQRRVLSEKVASLQEKIRQDSARLRSLSGESTGETPAKQPEMPDQPDELSAAGSQAGSEPEAEAKKPSLPSSPTMPGLDALKQREAELQAGKSRKPPSEDLLKAKQEAETKQAEAQQASTEVESATQRLAALRRSIVVEQELLDVANQKASQAQRDLSELNARRQPELAADTEAWNKLTAEIEQASKRYDGAQAEAQTSRQRLDELRDQLAALQQERIAALGEAEKKGAAADVAQGKVDRLQNPFSLPNVMQWLADHGPKMLAILIGALVLYAAVKLSGGHLVKVVARGGQRGTIHERQNRALTLVGVFQNVAGLAVIIGAALMLLDAAGIPIVPLMGGAAVVGLAVAFGAQNLVKDYFAGFMLLLEDQYGLNDVVKIGDTAGAVEQITLRITRLRDLEGIVHFIPHGTITTVSNMTHGWSRALLDIGVAYKEDTDRVMAVMLETAREMRSEDAFAPFILDNPEMLGVDLLGDSAVSIKMVIKTAPAKQWAVRREYLRRIKHKFDALGIEIPFPHRTLFLRHEEGEPPVPETR